MTTLADDLLKTRNIGDLRVLIKTLRDDAECKRTELQSMVGSQYHEFIQSADKISRMNEQSKSLAIGIENFWKQNQKVIHNVNALLGQRSHHDALSSSALIGNSSMEKITQELNGTAIWKDLSVCDVYSATIKGLCSFFLMDTSNCLSNFGEYLLSHFARDELLKLNICPRTKATYHNAAFLIDTIMDDARIFCTESNDECGNDNVEQKARTLASLSVLQCWKRAMIPSTELKSVVYTYLDCTKMKIDHLFDTILSQHSAGADIEGGLVALVSLLQSIIVEIYLMFFHHVPVRNGSYVNGLISFFEINIATDINCILSKSGNTWESSKLDAAELKHRMKSSRSWLEDHLRVVTERCSSLLYSLNSATQVAKLQQLVYSKCCDISPCSGWICSELMDVSSFSDVWKEACNELLVHKSGKHRRVVTSSVVITSEPIDTALILWSTVFRASFLHQVERLLQKSCEDILDIVHCSLTNEFSYIGLTIHSDIKNGVLEVHPMRHSTLKEDCISSTVIFAIADKICTKFDALLGKLLDDVITPVQKSELLMTKDFNSSSNDSQNNYSALSSQSLIKALQGNCCRLVGQILSLLRRVAESLKSCLQQAGYLTWNHKNDTSLIRAEMKQLLRDQFSSSGSKLPNQVESTNSPDHFRCRVGLLVIGRIVWLLKIRSNSIIAALSDAGSPSVSKARTETESLGFGLVSEEQFRSAFEIADTDGDGVVSRSEAFEALQALSIGDSFGPYLNEVGTQCGETQCNYLNNVSSLSYDEFILIFGAEVFSSEDFCPAVRFHVALENILALCHIVWAIASVKYLGTSFAASLSLDLGIDDNLCRSSNKLLWQHMWIDLENVLDESEQLVAPGIQGMHREKVLVPSHISRATFSFIHGISLLISSLMVSLDTMQVCYRHFDGHASIIDVEESEGGSNIVNLWIAFVGRQNGKHNLCHLVNNLLYELAFEHLLCDYDHIISKCINSKTQWKQDCVDDLAMQLTVDLKLCEKLWDRSKLDPLGKKRAFFIDIINKCVSMMDPIAAELYWSPLIDVATQLFDSSRLLLFVDLGRSNDTNEYEIAQTQPKYSPDQLMTRFFPAVIPPRCALLPLGMTSIDTKGKGSNVKKIEHEERDKGTATSDTSSLGNSNAGKSNIMKWW